MSDSTASKREKFLLVRVISGEVTESHVEAFTSLKVNLRTKVISFSEANRLLEDLGYLPCPPRAGYLSSAGLPLKHSGRPGH